MEELEVCSERKAFTDPFQDQRCTSVGTSKKIRFKLNDIFFPTRSEVLRIYLGHLESLFVGFDADDVGEVARSGHKEAERAPATADVDKLAVRRASGDDSLNDGRVCLAV